MLLAQIIIPVAGAIAVLYAIWLAFDVLRRDRGTPAMQEVAGTILEGANAFLRRQYQTIGMLAIVTAVVVGVIVGVLFRLFGAPIKAFIDKYLGLAVAAFAVLVVGGFLAFTLVGGKGHQSQDRCATATAPV